MSSKLLSVAEDSVLTVYTISAKDDGSRALERPKHVDLDNEYYAIASNSQDQIALGGEENKVDLHSLGDEIVKDSLSSPALAFTFGSKVQRLQWIGRFIIGYAEIDSEA